MTLKEKTTSRGMAKARRFCLSALRDSPWATYANSLIVRRTIKPSAAVMVCDTAGASAAITVDIMLL